MGPPWSSAFKPVMLTLCKQGVRTHDIPRNPERYITVAAPALTSVRLCPVGCECVKTPRRTSRQRIFSRRPRRDDPSGRSPAGHCPRRGKSGGHCCSCRGHRPPRRCRLVRLRVALWKPCPVILGSCFHPRPPAGLFSVAVRCGCFSLPRVPVDPCRCAGSAIVRPDHWSAGADQRAGPARAGNAGSGDRRHCPPVFHPSDHPCLPDRYRTSRPLRWPRSTVDVFSGVDHWLGVRAPRPGPVFSKRVPLSRPGCLLSRASPRHLQGEGHAPGNEDTTSGRGVRLHFEADPVEVAVGKGAGAQQQSHP